jgi:hypothetical protein
MWNRSKLVVQQKLAVLSLADKGKIHVLVGHVGDLAKKDILRGGFFPGIYIGNQAFE